MQPVHISGSRSSAGGEDWVSHLLSQSARSLFTPARGACQAKRMFSKGMVTRHRTKLHNSTTAVSSLFQVDSVPEFAA